MLEGKEIMLFLFSLSYTLRENVGKVWESVGGNLTLKQVFFDPFDLEICEAEWIHKFVGDANRSLLQQPLTTPDWLMFGRMISKIASTVLNGDTT